MRRRMIVPFVLLIMAAVSLLTLATMTLATHEASIAAGRIAGAGTTRQPHNALRVLAREWATFHPESMSVGGSRTVLHSGTEITLRRLSRGLFHGRARARSGAGRAQGEAVFRILDVERALSDANEAVVTRAPIAAHQAQLEVDDTTSCTLPFLPARPAVPLTVAAHHQALGFLGALVDSAHADPPPGYALGGVRWSELAGIADRVWSDGLFPGNDSTGTAYPLLYAPGDLLLTGGSRGLLFVDGNLEVGPAAVFRGIITVRGTLTIRDGAQITGAIRVLGAGLSSIGAALITHSRCLCAEALLATPANRRLISAERFYIPAF